MARPGFCLVFHQTTQRARGTAGLGQDSTRARQHLAGSELAVDKTQGQELPGEVLTLGMSPFTTPSLSILMASVGTTIQGQSFNGG